MTTTFLIASSLAAVAAAWDIRTRRVPNALTLVIAVAGFATAVATGGWAAALTSLGGGVVGLGLFLPFFALGGMGGGDVKLLAALGMWLGPYGVLLAAFWAALAGGVLALMVSGWHGYLRTSVRNLWTMFGVWRMAGLSPVPGLTLADSGAPRLAYAVPIAIGAMVALWRQAS